MNPTAFRVLVAIVCFGLVLTADELEMRVEPSVIVETVTPEMSIDCRPGSALSAPGYVGLMIDMIKADVTGTTFIARQRLALDVIEENRTSAKGHIHAPGSKDPTFLTVTIEEPTPSDEGIYSCRFIYLDEHQNHKVHHLTVSTNVTIYALPPPVEVQQTEELPESLPLVQAGCDCGDIRDEILELKVNFVEENKRLRDQLHSYNDSCRVSFSVGVSDSTRAITNNGHIEFDDVINNKGDAYDVDGHVFVAPCTGQYYLSLTLRSWIRYDTGHVYGVMLVDGDEVLRTATFTDVAVEYLQESSSNDVIVTLKQGQSVHVITKTSTFGSAVLGERFSLFSGFFVSP